MAHFTFKAYVISVLDARRICVRVDKEDIDAVSKQLTTYNGKTTIVDTIVVNVKDARFTVSIDWKELTDLIGVHIRINAKLRRYSYWRTREVVTLDNSDRIIETKCTGVSFLARAISNIT
jgi:hypothetical protein